MTESVGGSSESRTEKLIFPLMQSLETIETLTEEERRYLRTGTMPADGLFLSAAL